MNLATIEPAVTHRESDASRSSASETELDQPLAVLALCSKLEWRTGIEACVALGEHGGVCHA